MRSLSHHSVRIVDGFAAIRVVRFENIDFVGTEHLILSVIPNLIWII